MSDRAFKLPVRGRAYLLALGSVTLWGAYHPVSKLALLEVSPGWLTFIRYGLAFVTLVAIAACSGGLDSLRRMNRRDAVRLAIVSLCGNTLSGYLVTVGVSLLPAAIASLLANSSPLLVAMLAPIMLGERMTRWAALGLIAGLLGVGVLLLPGANTSGDTSIALAGVAVTLLGGWAWAFYILLGRRLITRYDPIAVTAVTAAIGLPLLFTIALVEGRPFPGMEILVPLAPHLLLLGPISTGLGFAAWMLALRALRASSLAAFQYFVPVAALVFSGLLLGERPTPIFLVGAALVLSGVAAAQARR